MTSLAVPEQVTFVEPSLLVHAFAPLTSPEPDRSVAREHLRSLWDACDRLGMSQSRLQDIGSTFVWPDVVTSARFQVLAARGTPDASGARRQAILFHSHDVMGLAIALEDPGASKELDGWRELYETWRIATADRAGDPDVPPPDAVLGETFTFLCGFDMPEATPEVLGSAVSEAIRRCGLAVWDRPYEPARGVLLWDGEAPGERRVVAVLGPTGSRDELSRLFWWEGRRELAPMARYQVDAAKLRYELRVYRVRKEALAVAMTRVERAVDRMLAAGPETDPGSPSDAGPELVEAQADSAGLVIQVSYLRALRQTVDIARRNMALLAPAREGVDTDTMVHRDRTVAERLSEQVSFDIGYAEAAMERARHATELATIRARQSEQRLLRQRTRLVLFQTAMLSALLTGLGAIATFDLSLHVARPLRLPLLAALVTLLFAAPIVAGSWHEGFRTADRVVIALLGASSGWLAVVGASTSAPWFAVMAGVGAGVAISLGLASRRPRRREATPGSATR